MTRNAFYMALSQIEYAHSYSYWSYKSGTNFVISIHSIQLEFVVEANLSMYLPFKIFFVLSHCKIENGVYLMRILNQTRSRHGQALVPESYGR